LNQCCFIPKKLIEQEQFHIDFFKFASFFPVLIKFLNPFDASKAFCFLESMIDFKKSVSFEFVDIYSHPKLLTIIFKVSLPTLDKEAFLLLIILVRTEMAYPMSS
jgi:hypothetical protein